MKTRANYLLPLVLSSLAAAALLLSGCGAPTSRGSIGSTPKALDPADWNGHWRSADDSFVVRVADGQGGLLEIVDLKEKDGRFEVATHHLYLREEGDATLFNLLDPADPEQSYTFGRVVRKDNVAIFWPCRTDSLEQLIGRGLITGQVTVKDKTRQVLVTGGYDALGRQLGAREGWLMLQMEEPFTIIRERTEF
jgi:hypothetical protein